MYYIQCIDICVFVIMDVISTTCVNICIHLHTYVFADADLILVTYALVFIDTAVILLTCVAYMLLPLLLRMLIG